MTMHEIPDHVAIPADMCPAVVTAINAMTYVCGPDIWPHFVKFITDHGIELRGDTDELRTTVRDHHIMHMVAAHRMDAPRSV